MVRKELAGILVEEKILGARDVERVERERAGRPLWDTLLTAELTTEEELFFVLAQRFSGAVATDDLLDQVTAPEAARRVWSREDALGAGLLPVELDETRATVVMVDPSDEATLQAFLARVQLEEGRALLARKSLLERAIARSYPVEDRTPKTPPKGEAKAQAKVEIHPQLQAELQRLPERALKAEPLTPLPRLKRRRSEEPHAPADPKISPDEALKAEERLTSALLPAVEVLARELERRLLPPSTPSEGATLHHGPVCDEMARLVRRVARHLGLGRRAADEVGVAAYLYAIDRKLRHLDAHASELFAELGWAAAHEEGILPVLRALTAAAEGFGRANTAAPPLGARIINVVEDYLEMAASGEVDLGTVSQLLRASTAGAQVVDALLRVLESERVVDPTPATTVTATSLLQPFSDDKTQKKTVPVAREPRPRREKE
jgi:hypothetical protein